MTESQTVSDLDVEVSNGTEGHFDKRTAILDAATDVFAEYGFQDADVQVIAQRAGVGKGTVYRHFINKEQLFWSTTLASVQRWYGIAHEVINSGDDPVTKLKRIASERARFLEKYPNDVEIIILQRAYFRGRIPKPVEQYMQEYLFAPLLFVINEGIQQGLLELTQPKLFCFAYCSALYGTMATHCFFEHEVSLSEMTEHTVNALLNGVLKK